MKRKIYKNFSIIILVSVLLTASMISLVFYRSNKLGHENRLKNILEFLGELPEDEAYYERAKKTFKNMRLTLIDKDGKVLYDSDGWPDDMDGHEKRSEFIEAREKGRGSALRYSDTMHENYYYYALRLESGSVLRISEMQQNIYRTFQKILIPLIFIACLSLIITFLIGQFISKSIVDDLKAQVLNLTVPGRGEVLMYKELYPVRRVIEDQQESIRTKINDLEDYRHTIEVILENMKEGLVFVNDVNRVELINKRALDLLNRDLNFEYRDRSIFYLSRNEDFMRALSNPGDLSSKVDLEMDNRRVRVLITPINSRGELNGKVLVLRDVTEDARLERERREFTSNVAHELKTPLTSIIGYAELLSAGKVNQGDTEKIGGVVLDEGKRLLSLIESMMELSKLEEMDEIPKENIQVDGLVKNTLELYRLRAGKRRIRLEAEIEEVNYNGNRKIIEEIVYNLIDNAYKYGRDNGYIKLTLQDKGDRFRFMVEDDGIGISVKDQEKIFQRFYTVDSSRHRKDSSGLGLSIVKHGVDKLGGKIHLLSTQGQGSKFTVEIPYEI